MKKILLTIIAIAGVWMNAGAVEWVTESAPTTSVGRYILDVNTGKFVMAGMNKNNVLALCENSTSVPSFWIIGDNSSLKSGNYYLTTGLTGDECTTNNGSSQGNGRYGRKMTFVENKTNGTTISYKIYRDAAGDYYLYGKGNQYLSGTSNTYKNNSKNMFISETQWINHWIVDAYEKVAAAYKAKDMSKISKASKAWAEKYLVPNLNNAATYQQNITSPDLNKNNVVSDLTNLIEAWNANPENYARMIETEKYGENDFGENWTEGEVERKFWGGEYNTLCLPFDITVADLESVLGEGNCTDVVEFSSYDGETLKFTTVAGTLSAGTPYMVQVTNDVENAVISHSGTVTKTAGKVEKDGATFIGTFSYIEKINHGDYVINGDKYYYVNSDVKLKGFRGYFTIPETEAKTLSFSVEDNEADGITNIESNSNTADGIIYNLAGQRVNSNAKGIVIKNGKKYLIK